MELDRARLCIKKWHMSFHHIIISSYNGWGLCEGCRESKRCSRDTYQESYITKYTGIRRLHHIIERITIIWERIIIIYCGKNYQKKTIYYRKDSNHLGAEKGGCVALVPAEGVALHRETSLLTISWSEFTWSSKYLLQTGLAPWEFEFPFPGSLWSNFQVLYTHT